MSSIDLTNLIRLEMENRGIKKYSVKTEYLDINEPRKIIDLGKYIWLFASESMDTKIHTVVELKSPDTLFVFNKSILESMTTQFKFFTEELDIVVRNYGLELLPFRLEFIKIIPEFEEV